MALAACLSCIAIRPPAHPNRKHYVERLLQPLPIALQQLASQQHGQLTSQQSDSADAAAVKGLHHTRTLMMFMQSWRDAQPPEQAQQNLSPAAEAFISCWGLIQQIIASGNTSTAMQESTAACCTAAVRMHLAACMSAMPAILHAAACGVAGGHPTAHLWVPPMAAALDQLDGQELSQLFMPLQESLSVIDSSAAAQKLGDRTTADANPELSLVRLLPNTCCTSELLFYQKSMQGSPMRQRQDMVKAICLILLAGNHASHKRNSKECRQAACSERFFLNSANAGAWHLQGSKLHELQP